MYPRTFSIDRYLSDVRAARSAFHDGLIARWEWDRIVAENDAQMFDSARPIAGQVERERVGAAV